MSLWRGELSSRKITRDDWRSTTTQRGGVLHHADHQHIRHRHRGIGIKALGIEAQRQQGRRQQGIGIEALGIKARGNKADRHLLNANSPRY